MDYAAQLEQIAWQEHVRERARYPVDWLKLLAYHQVGMAQEIPYVFGAKPPLDADPDLIEASDCSGWVRYLLYHASAHQIILPEGSWEQREWFADHGYEMIHYQTASLAGVLCVAFMLPHPTGHVWLQHGGMTLECYGGHGVGRRQWNAAIEGGASSLSLEARSGGAYLLPTH